MKSITYCYDYRHCVMSSGERVVCQWWFFAHYRMGLIDILLCCKCQFYQPAINNWRIGGRHQSIKVIAVKVVVD